MIKRAKSREGMVTTTIALEEHQLHELKLVALQDKAAITELVRQAIGDFLSRRQRRERR